MCTQNICNQLSLCTQYKIHLFIILGVALCSQFIRNMLTINGTQYQIHLFIILGVALCTQFIRNMLTINVRNIKSIYLSFQELRYVRNLYAIC
jgi:hypothetical protein